MKSAAPIRDEHVLVSLTMSPFRGTQRAYRHLSSVAGFGIVASLMTAYCAALSVEAIYVAMPGALAPSEWTEDVRRERRFVPKPYVADGADLSRLSPLPPLSRLAANSDLVPAPGWLKTRVASSKRTVWDTPGQLAIAVLVALVVQRFEAMILRKRSTGQTLAEFKAANAVKQVEADPKAIALAELRARQHNSQGLGGTVGTFAAVCGLYGLELAAFLGSFAGGGNWMVNAVYGVLTIFGFEIFDRMGDEPEPEPLPAAAPASKAAKGIDPTLFDLLQ